MPTQYNFESFSIISAHTSDQTTYMQINMFIIIYKLTFKYVRGFIVGDTHF